MARSGLGPIGAGGCSRNDRLAMVRARIGLLPNVSTKVAADRPVVCTPRVGSCSRRATDRSAASAQATEAPEMPPPTTRTSTLGHVSPIRRAPLCHSTFRIQSSPRSSRSRAWSWWAYGIRDVGEVGAQDHAVAQVGRAGRRRPAAAARSVGEVGGRPSWCPGARSGNASTRSAKASYSSMPEVGDDQGEPRVALRARSAHACGPGERGRGWGPTRRACTTGTSASSRASHAGSSSGSSGQNTPTWTCILNSRAPSSSAARHVLAHARLGVERGAVDGVRDPARRSRRTTSLSHCGHARLVRVGQRGDRANPEAPQRVEPVALVVR